MQERVLIVEDNNTVARVLRTTIGNRYGIVADVVSTYADAQAILQDKVEYLLALVDLVLPDATEGEAVDLMLQQNVPVITMTGLANEEIRKTIMTKPIIDYVTKDHPEDLEYVIERIGEIKRNKEIKILVVDDSTLARTIMAKQLRIQKFLVFEASDGVEAMKVIEKHPDIRVVLTDYNMPNKNGLELTIELRRKYRREALSIIAISSESDGTVSSHLLKLGANDFIHKPFIKEEFNCRINNTVRALENLDKMLDLANKDYLTGLYNRRYFFDKAEKYVNDSMDTKEEFAVAMFDLDDFKQINDKFGHDAGDIVLKSFSRLCKEHIRGADIVARFGGEEFCIILKNVNGKNASRLLDALRQRIEMSKVVLPLGETIRYTASIGLCTEPAGSLTEIINVADKRLYKAKLWGKNRICCDGE